MKRLQTQQSEVFNSVQNEIDKELGRPVGLHYAVTDFGLGFEFAFKEDRRKHVYQYMRHRSCRTTGVVSMREETPIEFARWAVNDALERGAIRPKK